MIIGNIESKIRNEIIIEIINLLEKIVKVMIKLSRFSA